MKYIFYILFVFCSCGIQANTTPIIDSLHRVVIYQTDEEKLKTQLHIVQSTNLNDRLKVIDQLMAEATNPSNNLYCAAFYAEKGIYYELKAEFDSTFFFANKGLDILQTIDKKTKKDSRMLYVDTNRKCNSLLVNSHNIRNEFYLALNVVDQMLDNNKDDKDEIIEANAYILMAMTRIVLNQPEEGIKHVRQSMELTEKDKPYKYLFLLDCYVELKQYEQALLIVDTLEQYIKFPDKYNTEFLKRPTYFHGAFANIKLGNLQQAKIYIEKSEKVYLQIDNSIMIRLLKTEYYIATNNNEQALGEINLALSDTIQQDYSNIQGMRELKARILNNLGRGGEAYNLQKEVSDKNKERFNARSSALVSELEIIHRVDNLKSDLLLKDSQLHSFRLLLGSSILVVLLVIVVAIVVWRGNKKLRERNRDLYKRHIKLEEQNREIETIKRQTDLADADDIIMNKLDCYLEESKAFLDSEITRDSLAMQIGTNRQYLVAAIKEKRSQTFNEYIYMWRLKHAYNLIIHNKDVPISEIFLESGFSSQSVFNREFKKSYGMTPSELRMAAEEEEKVESRLS